MHGCAEVIEIRGQALQMRRAPENDRKVLVCSAISIHSGGATIVGAKTNTSTRADAMLCATVRASSRLEMIPKSVTSKSRSSRVRLRAAEAR